MYHLIQQTKNLQLGLDVRTLCDVCELILYDKKIYKDLSQTIIVNFKNADIKYSL